MPIAPIYQDVLTPFSLDKMNIKGCFTRLSTVLKDINLPQESLPLYHLLMNLITLCTGLLFDTSKGAPVVFTLRGGGILSDFVLEFDHKRCVRMRFHLNKKKALPQSNEEKDLFQSLGKGYLTISTWKDGEKLPIQEHIPLKGTHFHHIIESFLNRRLPHYVFVKMFSSSEEPCSAILILKAKAEEKQLNNGMHPFFWGQILEKTKCITTKEMIDLSQSYQTFFEKWQPQFPLQKELSDSIQFRCTCSRRSMKQLLNKRHRSKPLLLKTQHNGLLEISCNFCQHTYAFMADEFEQILRG